MKKFYTFCFWISLIIVLFLSILALFYSKVDLIKDFALPFAASIFSFGQLWQQEKQNEFEQKKYIKESYFELMTIFNEAYIFEADTSKKDFPIEFTQKCLAQYHRFALAREKVFVLFGDKSKEIDSLFAKVLYHLENMGIIVLNQAKNSSEGNRISFNTEFTQFTKNSQELSELLKKYYKEKIAN